MTPLSPLNEIAYEKVQLEMTYGKLFSYILRDFVTRADLQQVLMPSNLVATTTVNTAVVVAGASGPMAGTGAGAGNGIVTPKYTALNPTPASIAIGKVQQVVVSAGGAAAMAAIGAV